MPAATTISSASKRRRPRLPKGVHSDGALNEQVLLSLGDSCSRRPLGLRRNRRHVFTTGFSSAHLTGYRVVDYRRVQRHDLRLSRHGGGKHILGKPVRPLRSASDSADRIERVGRSLGAGKPGDIADRVSVDLRFGGRRCDGGHLCAHDGLRDRLVRYASQPGGVSRFSRHGNGAYDHVAVGGTAHIQPRLENVAADPRGTRRSPDDSNSLAGAAPPGVESRKCRFASYGWLYIGACGIGIGAFAIALTFRPYAATQMPETARV
jgi:hypothetical protein